MAPAAVFFDVGETLVDETEVWGGWADWLGVPRLTLSAALGAVIERSRDRPPEARQPLLHDLLELVRPDLDFATAMRERPAAERVFSLRDFYPDARPCLEAVRARGYRVGIAANQPVEADALLRGAGLPVEWVLVSDVADVRKPDPAFFERVALLCGLPPASIAYVGDRVDFDVVPAHRAGMLPVQLRRGPWGVLQWDWPGAACARLRVRSLAELPERLAELDGAGPPR
jgi:HAD superfamily hydrolase (TIGR01549 family)